MSDPTTEDVVADIIDFCRETIEYVDGVGFNGFLESRQRQRAVERTLELIGEAANRFGDSRPPIDVPWDLITRMRIVLAHAYNRVEPRILYDTAKQDVPKLLNELEGYTRRG